MEQKLGRFSGPKRLIINQDWLANGYGAIRFDEYQFAKYNRDTAVRLRDALFLVHPTAKDVAQQAIFDKLVSNNLQTPYT